MEEMQETALSRDEYRELEELVNAQERGEDMELFAFRKLCPTGEEYAFNPETCAVYQALEAKGLIQGAALEGIENGYVFFGITEAGVNTVLQQREASPSFFDGDGEGEGAGVPNAGEGFLSAGFAALPLSRDTLIITAAVGLLAGLVGGFIGAGIFSALA